MHENARHPVTTRASACGFYAAPLYSAPHDPDDWCTFSILSAEKIDGRETLRRLPSEPSFQWGPYLGSSLHKTEVSPREAS
jgi:hypothetical protein